MRSKAKQPRQESTSPKQQEQESVCAAWPWQQSLPFLSLAVEMGPYRNYEDSLLMQRHLELSEMPNHMLYGFHLFLPKRYIPFKTSVAFARLTRLWGTPRDLKRCYKSLFRVRPPVSLCVPVAKLSFEFLQPELSSVLLLLREFADNSSKHYIFPAVSEVSVEQAHPEELINTSR